MTYRLTTPWEWETWITADNQNTPYARLAGRPITGGTSTGAINPFLTDIPRGVTLLVNGTTVNTLFGSQTSLYTQLIITGRDSGARITIPVTITKVTQ